MKVKKNTIKLILFVAFILLVVTSSGFTAESKKAPPVKTDATAIEQERAPKASAEPAQGEEINWQVISSGGTKGTSTNFVLNGTVGQTAVGFGSSTNFRLSHGFWQEFGPTTCCNHDGIRGDANYDMTVNVADLTYLVCHLFCTPGCPGYPGNCPAPPCFEEGDVNGDASINVADLTYLVCHLFCTPGCPGYPGNCPPPAPCP